MNTWVLAYDGFDPPGEELREALCTLGNGSFATRGAAPEAAAGEVHYLGTYVAGLYNRLVSRVAGREVENEDLVNVPNWLPLTIRPEGGPWLDLHQLEVLAYRQELDLRRGVLIRLLRAALLGPAGAGPRRLVEEFLARNFQAGTGRLEVRSGWPSDRILDVAAAERADLITLAWRRQLAPDRAAVVREVLTRSPVPTILPPRSAWPSPSGLHRWPPDPEVAGRSAGALGVGMAEAQEGGSRPSRDRGGDQP